MGREVGKRRPNFIRPKVCVVEECCVKIIVGRKPTQQLRYQNLLLLCIEGKLAYNGHFFFNWHFPLKISNTLILKIPTITNRGCNHFILFLVIVFMMKWNILFVLKQSYSSSQLC